MRNIILSLIIFSTLFCARVMAQDTGSAPTEQDTDDFFSQQNNKKAAIDLPTAPKGQSFEMMDKETRDLYQEALRAHYIYRKSGYEHRRKVFDWQLFSSKVTFYLVILLVLSGIYFAGVQFHIAMRQLSEGKGGEPKTTDFKASATGIEISSPVLGVIILSISLAFFYLYLVYVYPIEEIF